MMWYRLRNWLKSKNTSAIASLGYDVKHLERCYEDLADQVTLLSKLSTQKEHVIIEKPSFMVFMGDSDKRREESMDAKRNKYRLEGYSFCHKNTDGDEVWAKY